LWTQLALAFLEEGAECSPVFEPKNVRWPIRFGRNCDRRVAYRVLPIIRLTDNVETRRCWRIADLPQFDSEAKEADRLDGHLVSQSSAARCSSHNSAKIQTIVTAFNPAA
jgi:hypothetical protein